MCKKISLNFSDIRIYNNYMVVVMKEGVHVSSEIHSILEDLANMHFYDREFVYITHRINSYSIDPLIYKTTSKIENLIGFAVVTNEKLAIKSAEIEKIFLSKPFKIFKKLEDAELWAKDLTSYLT